MCHGDRRVRLLAVHCGLEDVFHHCGRVAVVGIEEIVPDGQSLTVKVEFERRSAAPYPNGLDSTAKTWNRVRDQAAEPGRNAAGMEHIVVGNITLTDQPQGAERVPFVGTLDEIVEDIVTATRRGADEVLIDLNLQQWFTKTDRMLEAAEEIYRRAAGAWCTW